MLGNFIGIMTQRDGLLDEMCVGFFLRIATGMCADLDLHVLFFVVRSVYTFSPLNNLYEGSKFGRSSTRQLSQPPMLLKPRTSYIILSFINTSLMLTADNAHGWNQVSNSQMIP